MVLDESTAPAPDFTSDHSPDSDSDPYSPSSSATRYEIDAARLPRPAPIVGPLFGYTNARLAQAINARIAGAAHVLGRAPTPDEAAALAYWRAKALATASWGRPLGVAAGCYRAYQTAGSFRFPFLTPDKETFNPDSFGYGVRLQGARARFLWHVLRGSSYALVGSWVAGLLVGTYAATVSAVGEHQDPRLQDYIKAVLEKTRQTAARQRGEAVGHVGDPTGQGRRSASELYRESTKTVGADDDSVAGEDDASPSAGSMADAYGYGSTAEEGKSLAMSDGQMRNQEVRQQASARRSPTGNTASTFGVEEVERQPRSFDDDHDDTSPAGGEGASMDSGSSGGSVWERIRKQAGSSPSSSGRGSFGRGDRRGGVQQGQRQGSTDGDGFAFSSSEEDRQLAKDEAQKAFDERIERERRGGDFSGSDGERRW